MMTGSEGFELRTVVHLIRPWGEAVHDLDELRGALAAAPDEVLFHHTVQVQLRDAAASELPPDDLSAWVAVVVQEREVAERLSFAVQNHNASPEEVRDALTLVLDALSPTERAARRAPLEGALQLLATESLAVPTGIVVRDAEQLMAALSGSDSGIWFHHVIEEPWFGGGRSPLIDWLAAEGESRLAEWLREAACPIHPLGRSRDRLLRRWRQSRLTRRLAEASSAPEDERRKVGRETVARLVRRVTRAEDVL
jgi:hypothetical protein